MDSVIMEENFSNGLIDIINLPKFEETPLTSLKPSYWKVIVFNIALTFLIIGVVCVLAIYFIDDFPFETWGVASVYFAILILTVIIARINFKNKGYAFREHDVIYRSGAIAITTHVIPYNRIQHAALHEGLISRKLGLAAVEVFTAGGDSSDLKIPGIDKEQAESIRQLIVGRIINQTENE
ncbi:MAG: PH domain-containing protein [Flavobacterium sp.]